MTRLRFQACILAFAATLAAAHAASKTDWPNTGNDRGAQRYSPLTDITAANVNSLKVAWTYHMKPKDAARTATTQTTPLVIDGVMYVATPYGHVVALDPVSGKEIWSVALPDNQKPAPRGMAYWPGDAKHAPELLFGTNGGKLMAVDVKTGKMAAKFGDAGVVNLRTPDIMRGYDKNYALTSAPALYKNIVITSGSTPEEPQSVSGDVNGYDVVTGKLVWTFHTVPREGEVGFDTWAPGSTKNRSGNNVWNMNTVDDKTGTVFLAIGGPAADRWGGDRHGMNLFGNAVVAVNALTGKYLWHFQTLHHEIWDWDLPTPPMLFDVRKDGRTIAAVAAMNKSGYLFILDRATGKPIYPVTETPVPASTVTDEQAWPTQPIPSRPAPLARQSFSAATDVTTVTPELNTFCKKLIADHQLHDSVAFSPLTMDHQVARFPGSGGGPEWGGGAFDPKLGYFIVNTNDMGSIEQLEKKPGGYWGSTTGPDSFFVDEKNKLMCQTPPWGSLYAVNVNTGDIAWRTTLGVTDGLPDAVKNTGRPSLGAPLTTAGGLIFIGATDDSRFRAFDTATGKEIWTYKLDYSAHASPISYRGKDGKQYIAVVNTGGSFLRSPAEGDSVTVFALP